MTELSRAMLARGLGEYLLSYLEEKPFSEEGIVERECAWVLHQIVETLNDSELDDASCVDQIVSIVHAAGLSTSRHDF